MTVCVAALAEKTTLIGVSDRMLTAGDIEFEPAQAKIWVFTPSIVALLAGDTTVQGDILARVQLQVADWISKDPQTWVNVRDVAALYCQKYRELRREMAEAEVLQPLGLTIQSFLADQATMQPTLVSDLAMRLADYDIGSDLETIFMGIDNDGPLSDKGQKLNYAQIFSTSADKLSWRTTVGFASIGIGKSHAESQLMFSGHAPSKPLHETVLLTYAAKKRAEAAPGVGKYTDMVVIGPALGSLVKINDEHLAGLDSIYQKSRRANERAVQQARQEAKVFIDKVRADLSRAEAAIEPQLPRDET